MYYRAFETMNRKMKCDLGSKCKHPHLDVRDNHYCEKCRKLLHVFCAARTGEEDHILFCGQCDDNQSDPVVHPRRSLRNTRGKANKSVSEPQEQTNLSITGGVVTRSSKKSEKGEKMDQVGNTDPGEVISPSVECANDNENTHSIPTIITEESECPNYLISTITQSDNGDWRYLDKEYFFTKKQRRNEAMRKKNEDEWEALRKKVMIEIDSYLHSKMLLKAQRVGLKIDDGDKQRLVSSFWEIGKAFKRDDSPEMGVKIHQIIKESFDEEGVFSYYCENKIMKKLKLKYIETENNDKDMGSIARMVVKRKCDLAKVINKRVESTHQQRVIIRRSSDEVKQNPVKDPNQAFLFGDRGWLTKDGCELSTMEKSVDYYKMKLEQLQKKYDDKEKVRIEIFFVYI